MNQNYPEYIMKKVREFNYLNEEDTSRDEEFQSMSPEEVFDQVLKYDGIIGYRYTILRWIADIFKVKLDILGDDQSRKDFTQGLRNIFRAQDMDYEVAKQMADIICDTVRPVLKESNNVGGNR